MNSKYFLSVMALGILLTSMAPAQAQGFFWNNHPRRSEVLRRDNGLNRQIQADRGQLGGNYRRLENEDRAIRHQEQRDARFDNGHITAGEQRQLNREENRLQRQINRDHR